MKDQASKRERFLRDPLPRRLGALAASLARVSSSARRETGAQATEEMMNECRYFIEWTAAETTPEVASELVDVQVALAMWRRVWNESQHTQSQRTLLSFQAKKWSDQVLDWSGLLNES